MLGIAKDNEEKIDNKYLDIAPFLEWLGYNVLIKQPTSGLQTASGYLGIIAGILSTAVTIPLGYNFGTWLADQKNVTNNLKKTVIGVYFGSTSFIPVAALAARTTKNVFKKLVTPTSQQKKNIIIEDGNCIFLLKLGYYFYVGILGSVTAAADVYNTYQEFQNTMGLGSLVFMIPDAVSSTIVNSWAYDNLNRVIYKNINNFFLERTLKTAPDTVKALRVKMKQQLELSYSIVKNMLPEEVSELSKIISKEQKSFNSDEEKCQFIFSKTSLLFFPDKLNIYQNKGVYKRPSLQKYAGLFGGGIGAIAGFMYKPLAEGASDSIWDLLSVSNYNFRIFSENIFGIGAVLCRGALMAYASKDSFERFYEWFSNIPSHIQKAANTLRCRSNISCNDITYSLLKILTLVVSITSTAPRAEIVIENTGIDSNYGKLLFTCAIIGTFATRFWSLNTPIMEFLLGGNEKEKILSYIVDIKNILSDINENLIVGIDKHLNLSCNSPSSLDVVLTNENKIYTEQSNRAEIKEDESKKSIKAPLLSGNQNTFFNAPLNNYGSIDDEPNTKKRCRCSCVIL